MRAYRAWNFGMALPVFCCGGSPAMFDASDIECKLECI
jgi:hypothetical protein